jgi:hypothetical protein
MFSAKYSLRPKKYCDMDAVFCNTRSEVEEIFEHQAYNAT